ncbi:MULTISPECIES: GNAT family N-acetyltransferase [Vibrio]|uniref:GNAT family N-acetyltransferase n=1 Tax=Vibrio TaxID=662 RepID=UPI001EEB878D|nr:MULTISPECIES: GNAT family N-acetyltransferase [Vibrio]ELA7922217.1 GNAT family N-acetyltransferase [Vibrio alginolyticus]ELE6591740.1 GNAT family N-acetyltransferase [Vibrio alginolyticus]MCG6459101.1 GNAT family N-acetyltransferase [Vibrio parahaemolyticus]MCR9325448.1 GNAT family N-acetyltransferase [Vibrio alginolyticus]MCR9356050.1 GNAT family N-acetyltransferase [Vibrio alginolyticus]
MQIKEYKSEYKREVIDLILNIQVNEFGISITEREQPDLQDISNYYQHGNGNFWVCLHEDHVVGTISLLDIGGDMSALRKMFVHPDFRGKERGVSSLLLRHALDWAKSNLTQSIYLGTTAEFLAAHKFYEKNGFLEVSKNTLPESFPVMSVDTKFYVRVF